MKNLFYFFAAAILLQSCSTEPGYVINTQLDGITDGKAFLVQRIDGEYVNVDSALIENGKFIMQGSVVIPDVFDLKIDGKRGAKRFYLENSVIEIRGNADSLREAEVSGSQTNDEYGVYTDTLYQYYDVLRGYSLKMREARAGKDESQGEKDLAGLEEEYMAKSDSVYDEMVSYQMDYLKANPSSYLSPSILQANSYSMDATELEEYLSAMDESLSASNIVKNLQARVEVLKKVAIGQPAPDFTQNDSMGNPVSLSSFKGKYVLIDFWAAWCGPCRGENPNVVKAYNTYNDKGFEVLGISLDDNRDSWLKAVKDDHLSWTHLSELNGWSNSAARLYGVNAIPGNFLINDEGIIVARNIRGEELQEKLAEIFN